MGSGEDARAKFPRPACGWCELALSRVLLEAVFGMSACCMCVQECFGVMCESVLWVLTAAAAGVCACVSLCVGSETSVSFQVPVLCGLKGVGLGYRASARAPSPPSLLIEARFPRLAAHHWCQLLDGGRTEAPGHPVLRVDLPQLHIHDHLDLKEERLRQRVQEGVLDDPVHLLLCLRWKAKLRKLTCPTPDTAGRPRGLF